MIGGNDKVIDKVMRYLGRVSKYKELATHDDILNLQQGLSAMKEFPEEQGKLLLLRYFKLANYTVSKNKEHQGKEGIYYRTSGRGASSVMTVIVQCGIIHISKRK